MVMDIDRVRLGITGVFRNTGVNDNGRRVEEFSTERVLYVGNIL